MSEKKKDIMDSILTGDDEEFAGRTKELDCLIYRTGSDAPETNAAPRTEEVPSSWKITKGDVSVEIWEGRAKIKVKVGTGAAAGISMKRLASIAVDAIMAELEKERSK